MARAPYGGSVIIHLSFKNQKNYIGGPEIGEIDASTSLRALAMMREEPPFSTKPEGKQAGMGIDGFLMGL